MRTETNKNAADWLASWPTFAGAVLFSLLTSSHLLNWFEEHISAHSFTQAAKTVFMVALGIFVWALVANIRDVASQLLNPPRNLKLEIKTRDGAVLATGLDPTNVQEIERVVERLKEDSGGSEAKSSHKNN